MNNTKIRVAMALHGMRQYEVAKLLGWAESKLSQKLRDEMPEEEQDMIVQMIEDAVKA